MTLPELAAAAALAAAVDVVEDDELELALHAARQRASAATEDERITDTAVPPVRSCA